MRVSQVFIQGGCSGYGDGCDHGRDDWDCGYYDRFGGYHWRRCRRDHGCDCHHDGCGSKGYC
jgi:hypothetical protein